MRFRPGTLYPEMIEATVRQSTTRRAGLLHHCNNVRLAYKPPDFIDLRVFSWIVSFERRRSRRWVPPATHGVVPSRAVGRERGGCMSEQRTEVGSGDGWPWLAVRIAHVDPGGLRDGGVLPRRRRGRLPPRWPARRSVSMAVGTPRKPHGAASSGPATPWSKRPRGIPGLRSR